MSEFDGGDLGGHDDGGAGFGDVHAGHEDFNLDHGQQAFGNENDHLQDFQAFGNEHDQNLDEHFAQGHAVEADTPDSHYAEQDYTNADVHASESDASFGEQGVEADHSSSFGDLDHLRESFDADTFSEHGGAVGGGEISAVSN